MHIQQGKIKAIFQVQNRQVSSQIQQRKKKSHNAYRLDQTDKKSNPVRKHQPTETMSSWAI